MSSILKNFKIKRKWFIGTYASVWFNKKENNFSKFDTTLGINKWYNELVWYGDISVDEILDYVKENYNEKNLYRWGLTIHTKHFWICKLENGKFIEVWEEVNYDGVRKYWWGQRPFKFGDENVCFYRGKKVYGFLPIRWVGSWETMKIFFLLNTYDKYQYLVRKVGVSEDEIRFKKYVED